MKTVVVTGASSGIGLAVARVFLTEHYRVINLSRRRCPEPDVQSFSLDLAKLPLEPQLRTIVNQVFGDDFNDELHVVHNAAMFNSDNARTTTGDRLTETLQVNVVAAQVINSMLIPKMAAQSSIIFVGSTLAEMAVANSMTYVTSKHAQVGLMRALCQDLVNSGIHTATICPGFTDTEMLRSHLSEEVLAEIATSNAFQRLISPTEIADTIWWATQNPVINGSVIHANLGQIET